MPTKTAKKQVLKSAAVLYGIEVEFTSKSYNAGVGTASSRAVENLALQQAMERSPSGIGVDCSGRDGGGVECRIPPRNFEYYRSHPEAFDFIKIADDHGYVTDKSTAAGIHIHVDRNLFSIKSFMAFIKFLKDERDFLHKISNRRDRKEYTNIDTSTGKTGFSLSKCTEAQLKEQFAKRGSSVGNNCVVLNDHGPNGTVECRFFNATSNPKTLFGYLEFIRALSYFCKSARTKNLENFLAYCVDYKKKYPNLISLLQEYRYLSKDKTPVPIN